MTAERRAALQNIKSFPSLVRYLRDEMDWPIATDDFEDLTFEYSPEELGIDSANAAKIEEIKRLRPLATDQPWGIFFVKFEPKRLPVVALRRILSQVALRKRASANPAERNAWAIEDLLFISSYGEGDVRQISFAHFREDRETGNLPALHVLGWDAQDTGLHIDYVAGTLTTQLRWPDDDGDLDEWRERWRSAFTVRHREVITTSQLLAERLAELAREIRARVTDALEIETESGRLRTLMKAFQEALLHDLDEAGFADMYAQTVAYGLLSARVSRESGALVADDAAALVPVTNPFLREMLESFIHAGDGTSTKERGLLDFDEVGINDVVETLRNTNTEAVLRDFGDRNPDEDPVIHFYEDFLREYDRQQKVSRGVFYTPGPVVSYIVRSVDELLRTEFGLRDGLADITTWAEMVERHRDLTIPDGVAPDQDFVQILDPATGTGTFLVEVIDVIHVTLVGRWSSEGCSATEIDRLWNEYVPRHLLTRLHGYELLMAPYAIAHLKIGLKLRETGYRFQSEERARVFLTNALEPSHDFSGQFEAMSPALAHEASAVNEIKSRSSFTVILGNPPYSIASVNAGTWITQLSEIYKTTARERERQIQALSDDYVKFVRLSHWCIERSGCGLVGLITNNGYLDGHLFVDMRSALSRTFSSLSVVNLHGNSRTQERTPSGENDANVFDIQTGVNILVASRSTLDGAQSLAYADVWGTREAKYRALTEHLVEHVWFDVPLQPKTVVWLPIDMTVRAEWDGMLSLPSVFGTGRPKEDAQRRYAAGFVSQQDGFAIAFTREEVLERVRLLLTPQLTEEQLRSQYRMCTTNQWNFDRARAELSSVDVQALVERCTYRPFDNRWTLFHRGVVTILRNEVMQHLRGPSENVALLATRGVSRQTYAHAFVTEVPVDRHAIDNASESMFVFPLFLQPESGASAGKMFGESAPTPNLSQLFLRRLSELGSGPIPPFTAFGYLYGILHSPLYRERYDEMLRLDFPRIPVPKDVRLLDAVGRLGAELVDLHLLKADTLRDPRQVHFTGTPEVGRVGWADGTVWIDAERVDSRGGQIAIRPGTSGFGGVPERTWNFHIGGYQVLHKWLKDRQGRRLSDEDIAQYQAVVMALDETIRVMSEIDEVIEEHGGWPGAFLVASEAAS